MSILLSLMLAQARVLPEIDRRALDLQARAEAVQNGRPAPRTTAPAPRRDASTATRNAAATAATSQRIVRPATPAPRQAALVRPIQVPSTRPATIRRASGGALDLSAITTICRAAGSQTDPATFLSTMARAYSLDSTESQSLRTSCAAYLAGRADARTSDYGAPAH